LYAAPGRRDETVAATVVPATVWPFANVDVPEARPRLSGLLAQGVALALVLLAQVDLEVLGLLEWDDLLGVDEHAIAELVQPIRPAEQARMRRSGG
jgi:hypothetical protein